jgi:hypothetical protein
MCFAERRKNRRLSVRLAIEVRLNGGPGRPATVEKTFTRNISPGDMYFESALGDRLRIGDKVEAYIELPLGGSTIFSERRLEAQGRVVRLDRAGDGEPLRGAALVFDEPPAFHTSIE